MIDFDDEKRHARLHVLRMAGSGTQIFVNEWVRQNHDNDPSIAYMYTLDGPEAFINAYLKRLKAFKKHHRFGDDKRIDMPKVAALSVGVLLEMKPNQFFDSFVALVDTVYYHFAYADFVYRFVCGLLEIRFDEVPDNVRNYFMICFSQREKITVHDEWLVWAFSAFQAGWGGKTEQGD